MTKPPNRWLAALLSFLVPGTGQLYAGNLKRALTFLLSIAVAILLASYLLLVLAGSFSTLLFLALMLAVPIVAARDAWRMASRWPADRARPEWSRWFVLLPFSLAGGLAIGAVSQWRKEHVVEAFRVPSGSMEPTVHIGEYLFADKRRSARQPELGAVLVFESIEEEGLKVLKRVVALPHDTIEMQRGVFRLNGKPQAEPYLAPVLDSFPSDPLTRLQMKKWQLPHLLGGSNPSYSPDVDHWGPLVVPPDSFFALGDNRSGSYDSRYYGFVPLSSILGRVAYVYFSRDADGAIQWERIGKRVR